MERSSELTGAQSQIVAIVCGLSSSIGSGIGFRDIIRELAILKCKENGIENPTDDDVKRNSVQLNTITGHIERIIKKTGKTLIAFEETAKGGIKPNSLRAANMAVASQQQKSENCRNGSGWSIVIVGQEVAFTIFSETGIVKHDKIALSDAIAFCDRFKVPANMAIIDRVSAMAEKQAKMAVKVTA